MSTINGKEYRLPTLDVFQEFALASKLSPILSMMSLQEDRTVLARKFPQAFTALAVNMPRQDKDEVLAVALTGVTRQEPGSAVWAPVYVNGRIMYQDISMQVVLQLMWELIVAHKLIDFFSEDPSSSTDQPGDPAASSGSDTPRVG